MSAAELIKGATEDGVTLSLSPIGKIRALGKPSAVNRWLPVLQQRREDVAELLRQETRPTKTEAEAELRRLVKEVASFHGFTSEEEAEALRNALVDFEAALTCFRALRQQIG